ncbi:MAG: isochorismatase family protein [Nitrososphaerota archaeon]
MTDGSLLVEIITALKPLPDERIIKKPKPSDFFGTDLHVFLRTYNIDTLIITGCVTSGCVRATIVDGFSYDYRCIVPKECVVDRNDERHLSNLRDIAMKYADVTGLDVVLDYIRTKYTGSL